MRILIDMDGVIADFLSHWCSSFNSIYEHNVQPSQITTWRMHESIPGYTSEQCENIIWSKLFFLCLRPIDDAVETIIDLGKRHEIVFVTNCKAGHEDKEQWLKNHFEGKLNYKVVFTAHKELVKGDVFIDDYTKNLEAWEAEWPSGEAICFNTNYNQEYKGSRLHNWVEIWEYIKQIEEYDLTSSFSKQDLLI